METEMFEAGLVIAVYGLAVLCFLFVKEMMR